MASRVALTMRIVQAAEYPEPRDCISHDWLARLGEWNAIPLPIPNLVAAPEDYLDALGVDLLVLTGGDDLGVTPARDATERKLLARAIERGLAVFGVCRGMQLVNDHFGGRLCPVDGHVGRAHTVAVAPSWHDCYGAETTVNSYHSQGVSAGGLADGLIAAAHDPDGNVEAFHHRTLPIAAVMWHAERTGAPQGDRALVRRLRFDGAFWR